MDKLLVFHHANVKYWPSLRVVYSIVITDEKKPVFKCADKTFTTPLTAVTIEMLILLFAFDLAVKTLE